MTKSIKILLIILTLLNSSSSVHAYRWIMNNFTSKILLVQIELLYSGNPYFILIEPKKSADFDWSSGNTMAGFCLGKIKYLVADDYLLKQQDLINKQTMEVRDTKKLLDWLDNLSDPKTAKAAGLAKPYERKEADLMLVKDELFSETVSQAKKLTGTKIGAKIVDHFANLVKESKCRGRDIMIVEKNGKIEFYTLAN
jgi:hypothetical protein